MHRRKMMFDNLEDFARIESDKSISEKYSKLNIQTDSTRAKGCS